MRGKASALNEKAIYYVIFMHIYANQVNVFFIVTDKIFLRE